MNKLTFVAVTVAAFVAPQFALAQNPVTAAGAKVGDMVSGAGGVVDNVATGAGKAVTGVLDSVTGQSSTPAAAPVAPVEAAHHHHHHH